MGLEENIKQIVNDVVDMRLASLPAPKVETKLDGKTLSLIAQYELISHKPYLTKKELALYLDCSERSIEEWSARAENPLPVGYAGSEVKAKREKIDQWVEREALRKRLKLAS